MDILFRSGKLQKICNSDKERAKKFGDRQAKRLKRRLDDLRAAKSLADIPRTPPFRCHELKLNRAGQISVDLEHPYRLIFVVANDPVPKRSDGGLDWEMVTAIEIVEVTDEYE